jgi:uncharacterized membrane protein HdeD (DUF308 family)
MARKNKKRDAKKVYAILSIVMGALILGVPQILSIVIGVYLLVTGILGLVNKN